VSRRGETARDSCDEETRGHQINYRYRTNRVVMGISALGRFRHFRQLPISRSFSAHAKRSPTAAGPPRSHMPSYGSNDGYGRQQFSSRPSTRQTDIGRRQMQSSVMASILAEEDIVRKEEEEQPVGGRILAQQQQQQRPQPQAQQGRPAPAQQQQQRAPPQHFQADPWEAMQRQQLERTQVEQEMAQREAALARMRHEEASFQSDDDGLRRLEQQRQAVLRKMAAEGRGPPPPGGGGGSPPPPGFGGRAYEASSSPAPPVTSERSSHRPVREVTWGAARAAETMTPRRSDELDHQGERAGEHASARREGRGWADPGGGWSTAGGARTREVGNPIAVERVPGAQHGVQGAQHGAQGAQHGGYSAQHGGYSAAAAGGGGADWSAWAAGERPNAFEVRGLLRHSQSHSQRSSPPSSNRASPAAPSLSPNLSPSMRASHVHGTPDEHAYKSHVGGVKMGYSGHVPGGRDHFGSAAVAGSMEVRWPLDCSGLLLIALDCSLVASSMYLRWSLIASNCTTHRV
jgi:hypothetical protein